jgi:PEP-CTERM motif
MKRTTLVLAVLALLFGGLGQATADLIPLQNIPAASGNDPTINVPFPTAGDAYTSATNGNGTIPPGGQTGFQWTAGDSVTSAIFSLPTNAVTDLTANWSFQDELGGGNTETWFVLVNGVAVAQATLPDDNFNGDILTITGTVNFGAIAPVAGGYQIELVLQNTVPGGGGSAAWLDGGTTGLSFTTTIPEPATLTLLGIGIAGMAGYRWRRRKSAAA